MQPKPKSKARKYLAAGKLKDKKAIITGGDSSRHDEKYLYMYKRDKWHKNKGENKMTRIKKIICLALAILIMTISLNGCNTMEGAGEDIEEAGETIQDAAEK